MRLRVLAFIISLGSARGSTLAPVLRLSSSTACLVPRERERKSAVNEPRAAWVLGPRLAVQILRRLLSTPKRERKRGVLTKGSTACGAGLSPCG